MNTLLIITNAVSAVVALALLLRCVWLKDSIDGLHRLNHRLMRDNSDLRTRLEIARVEHRTDSKPLFTIDGPLVSRKPRIEGA